MLCDIASAIRVIRLARQLSQDKLAKRCRTSRQHINSIERYRIMPTFEVINKIAVALGVTPVILVTLATAQTKNECH